MMKRWDDVPGVVIDHIPASTRCYIGSPSIAVLPDGTYVASHDIFGPGSTSDTTLIFRSEDGGRTWRRCAEIKGQFWSSLFIHRGSLYLMGTSKHHGNVIIRRSEDGGMTWTEPEDRKSGLLLDDARYHTAPVPTVVHEGRLWRAMEDAMGPDGWGRHFRAFVMSAPVDADLLDADSWICSNRLGSDPSWLDGGFGGWLEGNVVVTPEGEVVNILRADHRRLPEKAAVIHVSPDGRKITFDPADGFIDLPGGCKKFTIRYDDRTGLYWSLTNITLEKHKDENIERVRNTVVLISSSDLRDWAVHKIILHHPDTRYHAFQYLDWQFEGEDIIAVARTAYDDGLGGANNQHDANFMTFHRISGFSEMLQT